MYECFSILNMMTPFPYSIDIEKPITEARVMMRRHKIRHLPVTGNNGLIGLISDHDIKLMLGPEFGYPKELDLSVADVYVENPYVVDIGHPAPDVLRTLVERHIGSAIITKREKLAGILTTRDVCNALAQFLESTQRPDSDNIA